MPELPEVETIKRGLGRVLIGQQIKSVQILNKKQFQGNVKILLNKKITKLERRAKVLIFHLGSNLYLAVHLKMSGQLIYSPRAKEARVLSAVGLKKIKTIKSRPKKAYAQIGQAGDHLVIGGHPDIGYVESLPNKYTRIIFAFKGGSKLYFNDLRKFGWFRVLNRAGYEKLLAGFGPEALAISLPKLQSLIQSGKGPTLKQLLMDQTNLAGLGNIYASEVLFCAKVNPFRRTKSINLAEIKKIHHCIKKVLELALKHQGTSDTFYRTASGGIGTFGQVAQVYKREGQLCQQCGNKIVRKKLGGRSAHFCLICQK